MTNERINFNKLSITNIIGSINTDTVVYDSRNSNTLVFASMVLTDGMTKEVQRITKKTVSIYLDSARSYLNNAGQKYDFIKNKIPNSDFNHVIMTRRDVIDKISNENDMYDFVFYVRNDGEINSKLYDKLYSMTSMPMLEEWMPVLINKLVGNNFMINLNCKTVHNPARMSAYRVRVSKEQLTSLVIGMVSNGEVTINGSTAKSDVIDCVEGLDSYLNIFGDILAERIQNSFVPKYDPASNNYDLYTNNYDDSCYHSAIELYKAQKATIQAATENLKVNDVTFVIGEMGCGKTALGSGITYAHYGKKAGMTNIVMCPSHLVKKWKAEIEKLVPNSRAYIVKTIGELIALETRIKAKQKLEHTYIILSKENAKFSYETRPATLWSVSKNTFVCPCCGKALTKKERRGTGRQAYTDTVKFDRLDMMTQMAHNTTCMNKVTVINKETGERKEVDCNANLWSPLNKEERDQKWAKLGSLGWIMYRHVDLIFNQLASYENLNKKQSAMFSRLIELKNAIDSGEAMKGLKAPRKYSIAKYIRERYKGYIDYFICDELKYWLLTQ